MQLLSTKQHYEPSTEYYKRPLLLIEQVESVTEMPRSQRAPVFALLDFIRQSEEELSVFVRPLKDIELLGRFYTFNNSIEVKRFLLVHDHLINPLFEAYKHIKEIFGLGVDVYLEIHRDPEEDFEGLFVVVKTNLSPEKSLDLLDKFDEEWFLDNVSNEIGSIFSVTVRSV